VTLVDSKWCFIMYGDILPAVGDTITGDTSGYTANVYLAPDDTRVYVPNRDAQKSLTIEEFLGGSETSAGVWFQAPYSRANATINYAAGATPEINFTSNAKMIPLENRVTPEYTNACTALIAVLDSYLRVNGYDLRKHPTDGVTVELGNELSAQTSILTNTGLIEYKIIDIKPTIGFTTTQEALSLFNPTADRVDSTVYFEVVYIHNKGGSEYQRVAHIFPRAKQTAMPSKTNKEEHLAWALSYGALNSCGTLPQEMMFVW